MNPMAHTATTTIPRAKDQALELVSRTGRIKLVKAIAENDGSVARLIGDPSIRRYLPHFPERCSVEEARKIREGRAKSGDYYEYHVLAGEEEGNEKFGRTFKFIGETMAFHIDMEHRSCEAGIILVPEVQRVGMGVDVLYTLFCYVFEELEMHRVYMTTDSRNAGMRGWLENVAGARKEREEREAWMNPGTGEFLDVVGYAILEWEWRGRVKEVLEKRLGLGRMI
ncbi:hypothetical protein D9757_004990 [Collybiopsis confluens]|uniref:N-acetyltransferase domain-containing protein n=1 Tax=Collybiopsis confluens TaxID=2823264 RepID=A0A8H5HT75_9AGAR|nr:hypothetical protein D9757_004990 [Collybiopsis confluens]